MKDIQPTSFADVASEHINKNKTAMIGLVVLIVAVFAGYTAFAAYKQKYEDKAQAAFFEAERLHAANQSAKAFTKENSAKEAPPVNVDTSQVELKLDQVMEEFPKSKASMQASLLIADINLEKKNPTKAITALEKSFSQYSGNLIDSLIGLKLSGVYEQNNQCDKALPVLEQVFKTKIEELRPEALLRTALCEETLGQTEKAKQSYQKLATEFSDTNQGQQAQKYLKIL